MKRAFLIGLTVQLVLIGAILLILDDLVLPMARSPVLGITALCLAVASGYFAWRASPHPSWPVMLGMGLAGFLAIYAAIPVVELVVVLVMAIF